MAVEAAHTFGWHRWVGDGGDVVGIERFGASAPYERLYQEYGINAEHVAARVRALLARESGGAMPYRPSSPTTPLGTLTSLGQSVWLDFIHRRMLESGELRQLIERRAVRGVTSNPTIFEQAIGKSDAYDGAIAALAQQGLTAEAIYERLAVEDTQAACDQFRPIASSMPGPAATS